MSTILKIRNPWIINPFFYYGLMWILALIGYELSPSEYCLELDNGLFIFLLLTILIAMVFSIVFNQRLKNKCILINYNKPSNVIVVTLILFFALEFTASGGAPLLSYLLNNGGITYNDFGIPTLHVIIITFALFCIVRYSFQYLMFRQKKDLFIIAITFLYFILIYSRGIIVFSLIPIVLIYLIDKKISLRNIFGILFLFMGVSWIFGVLGNLRVGSSWNDTSYIFRIAGVDADGSLWYAPAYWVLEYLTCSLRTLNFNILEVPSAYSLIDMFYHFMPDFLAKRLFIEPIIRPTLQLSWCTTYSMYGASFATYGYIGMVLKFISYVVFGLIFYCTQFKDFSYKIIGLCLLSSLYVFSVFTDILMYSGYSFSLFYVLLFGKFRFKNFSYKF